MPKQEKSYQIKGIILDKVSGKPLPDLTVEAFDKDYLKKDDFLGKGKTNEKGKFCIKYRKTDFVKSVIEMFSEGGPDIVLKIFDASKTEPILITKENRGASRFEEYIIRVYIETEKLQH